jgi:hypothetical protein
LSLIVALLAILVTSIIVYHTFVSPLYYEASGGNNKLASKQSLSHLGTRFEALGGLISLPSFDCLGCEFRGIVERLNENETQYSVIGEVVIRGISSIMPVSVLGTLNIDDSTINGTLRISDRQYTIEGISTTYSSTCNLCKQTLDLRGWSIQGDDVMSANIPLKSIK